MTIRTRLAALLGRLLAMLALATFGAHAHTLPISYLRLQPDADYLHLEFTFNAFELTFLSDIDDNKDGELDADELKAHGQVLANRVVSALKLKVGGQPVSAETAGMDPDMTGHHVRLRAHYKVDARHLPLTLESDLVAITSSSHLVQVTYAQDGHQRLAQLDSQTRKVTFQPFGLAAPSLAAMKVVKLRRVTFGAVALLAILLLVVVVALTLLLLRKPPRVQQGTPKYTDYTP